MFTIYKGAYTRGIADPKGRMHMHALSRKEKCVHVGKLVFSPWYLVPSILTRGIDSRYFDRSVEPRYLDPGIGFKWFWTMVLSKA